MNETEISPNTHVIDTFEAFQRLVVYADKVCSPYIVIDVETDSAIEKTANLYGIALCFTEKRAFYIVWRDQSGNLIWSDSEISAIAKWLEDICKVKKLINHNIIFDVLVLENNIGIDLCPYIYSDTILLRHTLAEEGPFGLKELAVETLGPWADKAQQELKASVLANGGKWQQSEKDIYKADTDILATYAMWDVVLTLLLFKVYEDQLKEEGLEKLFYEEEIMPLYRECTIPMKRKGFPIDVSHFQALKAEIEQKLDELEDEVIGSLKTTLEPFIAQILEEEVPIKPTGDLPKILADLSGIPLPVRKKKDKETGEVTETVTLAATAVKKQKEKNSEHAHFYDWILSEGPLSLPEEVVNSARQKIFLKRKNSSGTDRKKPLRYVFNLNSNEHLAYYFFDYKKYDAKGTTKTGKKQINANFIDELKADDPIAQKIIDYKKLQKLLGTYVNGILSRQINGVIYSSMLQFGTTSGRYSSKNPNIQNLPRIKDEESGLSPMILEYVNSIRKGFAAPKGYKIVNADFSQLEPCCFATNSGDKKLQEVFHKGEDLYSRVAIDVFKMDHLSANKKDPNFLKKVSPEFRNKAKVFTLAVPYGAEAGRIGEAMNCDWQEATAVINAYLSAYPNLKKYMQDCNMQAKKYGRVKTTFGRVRHLPQAKLLYEQYGNNLLDYKWASAKNLLQERRTLKNLLNNAKNFPIQGLAAHIVNRSMIMVARRFKQVDLDGWICLQCHDEITCVVKDEHAEMAKTILKDCMENTVKIAVPLVAEPLIGTSWADSK